MKAVEATFIRKFSLNELFKMGNFLILDFVVNPKSRIIWFLVAESANRQQPRSMIPNRLVGLGIDTGNVVEKEVPKIGDYLWFDQYPDNNFVFRSRLRPEIMEASDAGVEVFNLPEKPFSQMRVANDGICATYHNGNCVVLTRMDRSGKIQWETQLADFTTVGLCRYEERTVVIAETSEVSAICIDGNGRVVDNIPMFDSNACLQVGIDTGYLYRVTSLDYISHEVLSDCLIYRKFKWDKESLDGNKANLSGFFDLFSRRSTSILEMDGCVLFNLADKLQSVHLKLPSNVDTYVQSGRDEIVGIHTDAKLGTSDLLVFQMSSAA